MYGYTGGTNERPHWWNQRKTTLMGPMKDCTGGTNESSPWWYKLKITLVEPMEDQWRPYRWEQ